jgi:putative acetyltransferase
VGLRVRTETPADADAIATVTAAAFRAAPHSDHSEQHIIAALRSSGQLTVSLVAEAHGLVIGHVALSPVAISDGSAGWFGLGPLAVLPSHQGRGIGSRLTRAALSALRARGARGCVVLGEPEYYGRFGFRAEPDLILSGVPPHYFQALALAGPPPRGAVTYHAAFTAH